jgi:hypothetical protein
VKGREYEGKINLVDLAGSEKVKDSKAEGETLKEACYINKSLLVLSMVVDQLAKKADGNL